MSSKLKAQLARLGPIQDASRIPSGSPVALVLRPADGRAGIKAISASRALADRGLGLLRAKRAVEAVLATGVSVLRVPKVENVETLAAELLAAGVATSRIASDPVDVKALRTKLGLTQEQFALRFGFDIDAVQNWEQGRCQPDCATASYLRVIAARPDDVSRALEEAV